MATDYDALFEAAGRKYDLDPNLIRAVALHESSGNPGARSPAGALGLMQIMPDTARGLRINPLDPVQAIDGGARYLREGLDKTGNPEDALRYYHGGPDRSIWGPKTNAYVGLVGRQYQRLAQLGGTMSDAGPAVPLRPDGDTVVAQALDRAREGVAARQQQATRSDAPDAFGQRFGDVSGTGPAPTADPFAARFGTSAPQQQQASQRTAPAPSPAQPVTPAPAPPASGLSDRLFTPLQQRADAAVAAATDALPAPLASAARAVGQAGDDAQATLGRAGAGFGRGVMDVADTVARGGNALTARIYGMLPEGVQRGLDSAGDALGMPRLSPAQANEAMDAQRRAWEAANPGFASLAGRVVGNAAASAPILNPLLGPANAAGALARGAAAGGNPLVAAATNLGTRAATGAAAGAGGALLTSGANDASVPDQLRTGAGIGAALGTAGSGARALFGALAPQMEPHVAALYQRAQQLGINLPGWRVSPNGLTQKVGDMADSMPLSGAGAAMTTARGQFTAAVAHELGENAATLTPAVMQRARTRIGAEFDRVAQNTTVQADQPLMNRLAAIENDAARLTPDEFHVVRQHLHDVLGAAANGNGAIPGNVYQSLTRQGTPLMNAASSGNPNIARATGAIREALDDALERAAAPEMRAALQQARYQWRVMRTIEPLAEKAQADGAGVLNPALLAGRLRTTDDMLAYTGGGALGELAQIGTLFRNPPNSGTPGGLLALNTLGQAGMSLGTGSLYPLAAAAAPIPVGAGVSRLMRSDAYTNLLLHGSPAAPGTLGNALIGAATRNAAPAAAQLGNRLLPQPSLVPAPVL